MKFLISIILMFAAQFSSAAGFHYCSGEITNLVTRASSEDTQVTIEGMNGWAMIGYGGAAQSDMHKRQFSMLLSAYMAGRSVNLEFEDNSLSCSNDHNEMLIRFVLLQN